MQEARVYAASGTRCATNLSVSLHKSLSLTGLRLAFL